MKKMFGILALLAFALPAPAVMALDRNPSALQQQWTAVVAQAQKDNAAMTTSVQQLQSVKIDTNKRSK
jgi:hypothetical protein